MLKMTSFIIGFVLVSLCWSEVLAHQGPHCSNPMLIHYSRPTFRCFFLHGHGNGLGRVIEACHQEIQTQLEAVTTSFSNLDSVIQKCSDGEDVPRIRQGTLMGVPSSDAANDAQVSAQDAEAYDKCVESGSAISNFLLEDLKNCDNVKSCGDEAKIDAALLQIEAAGRKVSVAFEECVAKAARK